MRRAIWVVAVLVVVSGFANILVRHQHRLTFNALQAEQQQRDRLNNEWQQLLLEESTWSFQHIVEKNARARLDMVFPENIDRLVVDGR